MKTFARIALGALALSAATAGFAASGISTEEEHVLRGFFDRQNPVIAASKTVLASSSASADLKSVAQSELDMYKTLGTQMQGLYTRFKLVSRNIPGNSSPPLVEGESRGVDTLPAGATSSEVAVLRTLAGNNAPPGGRPAAGAGGPGGPGGPPAAPRTGGGTSNREGVNLAKLSGADFENGYLLLVIYGHEAMLRHTIDELNEPNPNSEMVAFAKSAQKLIATQSGKADRLYRGQPLQRAPRPNTPAS